jgi:hypothetical protein
MDYRQSGALSVKPTVYIETSIISYLAARPSNDLRVAGQQNITIDWWENEAPKFELYISPFVVDEASRGDPAAAEKRLAMIAACPELEVTSAVEELGNALVVEGPIPEKARIDAYHIATAAVHGVEYLLTWNCTHIANAVMRPRIENTCRNHGYEPPVICTPQELTEA